MQLAYNRKHYDYYIGIDPGKNTGVSVWHPHSMAFIKIESMPIHRAMDLIKSYQATNVFIRVEDARKRKWFGKSGREQLQGAGSIKRDCTILEDFLTDLNIPFEMVAPKNNRTKLTAESFRNLTGWSGRTNEHMRDSAMLCYGINF